MSGFITKKLSFFLLLGAWCVAAAVVVLFNYFFAGPKLGPVYDIALGFRPAPPVSAEILLIETEDIIEPGDVFSVLMTLSEAGATSLLIEVPVLGTGSGRTTSETELNRRVTDEFALLGRNIRNLFEAIRLGSIPPEESDEYVENLVELSERGRDRLNAAITSEGEAGSIRTARAAAVFGRSFSAVDLRVRHQEEIPWYSRPEPDKDGILRRIAPVMIRSEAEGTEHIVYHALKAHREKPVFEQTKDELVVKNLFGKQDEKVYRFPLDKEGNILLERPQKNTVDEGSFRRLNIDTFLLYEKTEREMEQLLKEAEVSGVYAFSDPEEIPLFLYTFSEELKEELLAAPNEEKLLAWKKARADYFNSLDKFLNGPSESNLVDGYEELFSTEDLHEDGISRLMELQNQVIRTFASLREKHRELVLIRNILTETLSSSFCIMGPARGVDGGTGIPESSALFANALFTGHCIKPGRSLYILIWSLAVSFAALACIFAFGPTTILIGGTTASLLCGTGFAVRFVLTSYWMDPFIPAAACLAGTIFLAVAKFSIGYGKVLRFRLVFGPLVNKTTLGVLLKASRPLLSETVCVHAAVIVVTNPALHFNDDTVTTLEASSAIIEFRKTFTKIFKQAGALILGFEGSSALACFGSPPERMYLEKAKTGMRYSDGPEDTGGVNPAAKAARCVTELLNNPAETEEGSSCNGWYFGIESGECAFSRSEETGITANGLPVIRAKMYAAVASRVKTRAVIGEAVKNDAILAVRKIPLRDSGGGTTVNCYVLPAGQEQ